MFVDDTNLFYSHKDLKLLFKIVNDELVKTNKTTGSNQISCSNR